MDLAADEKLDWEATAPSKTTAHDLAKDMMRRQRTGVTPHKKQRTNKHRKAAEDIKWHQQASKSYWRQMSKQATLAQQVASTANPDESLVLSEIEHGRGVQQQFNYVTQLQEELTEKISPELITTSLRNVFWDDGMQDS